MNGDDELLAQALLRKMGIEFEGPGSEMVQHAAVMVEALRLIDAKSKAYGNTWKHTGFHGTLLKAKIKVDRLMNLIWYMNTDDQLHREEVPFEPVEDSWLDLLVYATFGVQQWRWKDPRGKRD